jgi:hypothetical protein
LRKVSAGFVFPPMETTRREVRVSYTQARRKRERPEETP